MMSPYFPTPVGQQVGQQEGEADLVLRLLAQRRGVLSPDQETKVRNLEIQGLEALG